jgi:hypothetical protein
VHTLGGQAVGLGVGVSVGVEGGGVSLGGGGTGVSIGEGTVGSGESIGDDTLGGGESIGDDCADSECDPKNNHAAHRMAIHVTTGRASEAAARRNMLTSPTDCDVEQSAMQARLNSTHSLPRAA